MVLKPGQSTVLKSGVFMMHPGMEGPHDFRVHILSNDPTEPDKEVVVLSNWVP